MFFLSVVRDRDFIKVIFEIAYVSVASKNLISFVSLYEFILLFVQALLTP